MKVGSLEDWLVAMAAEAEQRGHRLDLFVENPIHPVVRERLLEFKVGLLPVSELIANPVRSTRWLARNYDVIQLHLWGPRERASLMAIAAWPAKVLYVEHLSGYGTGGGAKPRQWRKLMDRLTAVRFAGLAGVSDYVTGRVRRRHTLGESRVRTIYNGIKVDRFWRPPKLSTDTSLRVLAVSQLIPEKGVDVLLHAIAKAHLPQLSVVIAGDGPERDQLARLANELGISSQVSFVGVRDDVESLLDQCDVFVHPCRWQEAFGLAVAEAMAAGRPVIATRTGALPELVVDGETGLLVSPEDAEALSGALKRLAVDPLLRQTMGANGQARVHLFSLANSVQQHLDWCESAVPEFGKSSADVDPSSSPVSKKLLVFSYHYPPSTAVGAVRWHRMGELLAAWGWSISVVAKEPDTSPGASKPPAGVQRVSVMHRQSLLLRIANFRHSTRSAFVPKGPVATAAPEAEKPSLLRTVLSMSQEFRWARDAVSHGRTLATDAVLLSAGPPHSIHYTVSRLARKRGLPHVMDMRDPWSLVERLPSWVDIRFNRMITRFLEGKAVRNATLVVCNTGHAAEALRKAYPEAAKRIVYVMNGADPEDIPASANWQRDRFLCVHSGSIYIDRMPVALLKAARKVIDHLSLSPQEFGIAFRGAVDDSMLPQILQLVESLDLTPYVEMLPRIERQEAMRWTASAQLCVVLPQDSRMALPSKVFELAQLRSWLLVFAPSDSATATALRGTTAFVVEPEDEVAAADALQKAIAAFRAGERPPAVDLQGAMLRERQAQKLNEYLAPIAAKV